MLALPRAIRLKSSFVITNLSLFLLECNTFQGETKF